MRFLKYFSFLALFLYTLIFSQSALAHIVKKKCGNNIYIVKIFNGNSFFERRFELYYQGKDGNKKLFYKTKNGIGLDAACIQSNKKKYLMMFQEFCGGNVCSEEMYSIFDPEEKKMIVQAINWSKGNAKQVEKIIGYAPSFYRENDKTFFCCSLSDLSKK